MAVMQLVLELETSGHLIYELSYFDFICTGLEANQMPKKDAFGYDMKHAKIDEWLKEY